MKMIIAYRTARKLLTHQPHHGPLLWHSIGVGNTSEHPNSDPWDVWYCHRLYQTSVTYDVVFVTGAASLFEKLIYNMFIIYTDTDGFPPAKTPMDEIPSRRRPGQTEKQTNSTHNRNFLSKQSRSIPLPFYSMARIAIAKFNLKFSLRWLIFSVGRLCNISLDVLGSTPALVFCTRIALFQHLKLNIWEKQFWFSDVSWALIVFDRIVLWEETLTAI